MSSAALLMLLFVRADEPKALEFVGHSDAESVAIRPRVSGYITRVSVTEGASVKVGDLLFEIDPRPYQAKLNLAQAQLLQAEAKLKLTQATLRRTKAAITAGVAGQDQLDEAQAAVDEAVASIEAAKASKESATLDLAYTSLRSPISGKVGRIALNSGDLVLADQEKPLCMVVAVDRLTVVFDLDEASLLRIRRAGLKEKDLTVDFGLTDEKNYPRTAKVSFIDPVVDSKTGTVRVQAKYENADGLLGPGMYVRVRLNLK